MKAIRIINLLHAAWGLFRHAPTRLLWLCMFIPISSFGQEYGLEFAAQPISKDQRTKLDLNPEGFYSFRNDFELSFSIQLRDIERMTFGYIARIVDAEDRNIDIIYNGPESHGLQVVYGKSLTNITIPGNAPEIFENWTEIRLRYDLLNKALHFQTPDTSISQANIDFSGKIKIFFGRNDFPPIQTTDVPRMSIRDIKLYQRGKCMHHYPLDEMAGDEARDILSDRRAIVQNPRWIMSKYHNWNWSFDTYLDGSGVVCYEPGQEKVYMVGEEMLKVFSVLKDSIENFMYTTPFSELIPGSQAFYDTITNRLICYSLKNRTVHYFDFLELRWEEIIDGPDRPERFRYHNQFYFASDSVLYTFGGYSQHKYFNLVQRFDFKNNQWDTAQTRGDAFYPRMHAALGSLNDTLYILGGFGSKAGDQILSPEHYTDLLAFSLREKEFIKKYDFEAPMEGIDFANSMVINSEDQSYYVLATTIFEYETYLQLLRGTLAVPELIPVGDKIIYLFHNENSYCDLFFSKSSQELIAVTSLFEPEENTTKITVHKISFPPNRNVEGAGTWQDFFTMKVLGFLFILVLTATGIFLLRNRAKKEVPAPARYEGQENENLKKDMPMPNSIGRDKSKKAANAILFFGGFQVINKHGEDITKKFTPLLKELFLLIFLYSIKDKGISVPRLTELLWFSMDAKTAKNNRAVNIAKLKSLLLEIESCSLSQKTAYWQIAFDDSIVFNDYWTCLKNMNTEKAMPKEELWQFLCIIKKGPLLGNASYEWLDEFKLECSNQIIDCLMKYVHLDEMASDHDLMIQISDAILIFDMMHEEAIAIKCRALALLGKHSLAKEIFAKFTRDYLILYDEPYERSFTDLIKEAKKT
jgi:two-component SAPR family response regulator